MNSSRVFSFFTSCKLIFFVSLIAIAFEYIKLYNTQGLLLSFPSSKSSSSTQFTNNKNINTMSASKAAQVATTSSKMLSRGVHTNVGKIHPSTTTFFLCDIQERFRPLIYKSETIISTSQYLTSVATTLSIPIVATQQYTKVFGPTVTDCFINGQESIDELSKNEFEENEITKLKIFEKKKFSMMTDEVQTYLANNKFMQDRDDFVLFGIEAHVCVQQTCLDLLEMGKKVHVVVDCISSQQGYDREIALKRMENAGAYMTTAQSLAFMLMGSADHPSFKQVSKLTVGHMKRPNEFNAAYE